MKHTNCDKMILAILQGDEYRNAVAELNEHGFCVTILVGLNHEHLEEALGILNHYAPRREMHYEPAAVVGTDPSFSGTSVPVSVQCGGAVVFVLDVDRYERY